MIHKRIAIFYGHFSTAMYVAMNDGRISNPIILEIDPEVICWRDTKFADRNAVKNGAYIGGSLSDFKKIHFDTAFTDKYFDLSPDEQPFFQAKILVKNYYCPLNAFAVCHQKRG